ncbi:MAG: glycosyltransferase family 4 protein [Deltaproteobacteria bacterium]|nr:glycosyltransferase family 4 protein [Deltaproteobacteria bacterium]
MKKVKVVRIFSRLNIGGPSLQVVLLSEYLSSTYETILVTGSVDTQEGDMSYLLHRQKKYRHIFIPELGRSIHVWRDFVAFYKLVKLLMDEKPDVVHTHTAKAGLLGRLAALIARVPIRIHTFHGHTFRGYFNPFKTFIIIGIEKILAYFTTHVIAISLRQKEDLVTRYKIVSKNKVVMIPLGFDLGSFIESSTDSLGVKQQFQLPTHKYMVGIIGRLVPIKNHTLFLRIVQAISRIRQDVHFVIVGDGECKPSIKEQIKNMGIENTCSILGWQKELKPIYDILDIVCLTSLNEGTPVSLIEAQACGKVVIATDVGGVRDIVFSGQNGHVVSLNDEVGFTRHLLTLLDNPEMRQKMGEYGKKFVFNNFGKENLLRDIDALYSKLLAGCPKA